MVLSGSRVATKIMSDRIPKCRSRDYGILSRGPPIDSNFRGLAPSRSRFDGNLFEIPDTPGIVVPCPTEFTPVGFDLHVGSRIGSSNLLYTNMDESEFDKLEQNELKPGESYVLRSDPNGNNIYYFLTHERINLPSDLEIEIDARSSAGRVGLMCHRVGEIENGAQIISVQPYAFDVEIKPTVTSLVSATLHQRDTSYVNFETLLRKGDEGEIGLTRGGEDVFKESVMPQGLPLNFHTRSFYRARIDSMVLPFDVRDELDPDEYFDFVETSKGYIDLDRFVFYLMGTQENISLGNVGGRISREHQFSGTGLWGHFAGWINPGFFGGITMEVWSLNDRRIKLNDVAGVVTFDEIEGLISENTSTHYLGQEVPKLPKMFKDI